VIDEANLYAMSFRNTMLYGSVNTTLIFSFLILTASILLSLLSQLVETEREIRMLRVVGFSPKQFFSLFLSEIGQSLVFSAVISSLVGGFAAKMIVDLLTFNSPIPPSGLSFPMSQLVLSILSLIVVSLLMVVIAIRIIFRKETHKESKKSLPKKADEKRENNTMTTNSYLQLIFVKILLSFQTNNTMRA
ncbi:MAG: ABC transporter permease, partial [Candidatus Heimdallarchaeota archaeon]|nr:ABC transporter permease [Candidatus Heimdallarchaeota archaeon]